MNDDKLEIPITKLQWTLRGAQIFFAFLAMATISAVIAFDNKYTSSKILDNFNLFILIVSMFFAAAIVGVPYAYLQWGKFKPLAQALRHVRIEFVLSAIWAALLFFCSVALSIEFALRKCDASDYTYDFLNQTANRTGGQHTFEQGLKGACTTGRASIAFGWFALAAWLCSLGLIAKEWYDNRRSPVPKYDPRRNEVTMQSNSTRSSLEAGFPQTREVDQYKDQQTPTVTQPTNQQQTPQPYTSPPVAPSPIPAPNPLQIPNPELESISFPEPQNY